MTKKILSIDFDYFINTDLTTRNVKFPDGEDVKPKDVLAHEWEVMYSKYHDLAYIGVIDSFLPFCNQLKNLEKGEVLIADSHKEIKKVFDKISEEESIIIKHIDFHHDNYISGGNTLDCANWVRILMNEKPNTDLEWVRREDSETLSLLGEFPYRHTTDLEIEDRYDYVFLCYSPEWTPPHLKPFFDIMERCLTI